MYHKDSASPELKINKLEEFHFSKQRDLDQLVGRLAVKWVENNYSVY